MRQFFTYERPGRAVRLTRVYLDTALRPGDLIELPPAAAMHLAKVLRARGGEPIVLFTGDGSEFTATVRAVHGSKVTAAVGSGRAVDRESPLTVTLLQCVPRGDRMDLIVQKATELGVARIVPVLSRRSVVRFDTDQAKSKTLHWRAVAAGACEQCGRNRLPIIDAPRPLLGYLGGSTPPDGMPRIMRLLLDPEFAAAGAAPSLGAQSIEAAVEVAVGPEGGFAVEELEAFGVCGFRALKLGPRILRTETAAIAAITWLQSRFGDLNAGDL